MTRIWRSLTISGSADTVTEGWFLQLRKRTERRLFVCILINSNKGVQAFNESTYVKSTLDLLLLLWNRFNSNEKIATDNDPKQFSFNLWITRDGFVDEVQGEQGRRSCNLDFMVVDLCTQLAGYDEKRKKKSPKETRGIQLELHIIMIRATPCVQMLSTGWIRKKEEKINVQLQKGVHLCLLDVAMDAIPIAYRPNKKAILEGYYDFAKKKDLGKGPFKSSIKMVWGMLLIGRGN
ncbi:hypothetical protein Tco_0118075 [Tanacetum coccineum]